jgi:hypothetical protein
MISTWERLSDHLVLHLIIPTYLYEVVCFGASAKPETHHVILIFMRLCMAKKTGKSFENLTKRIFELLSGNEAYTKVEENVFLDSPDGPRQFDVIIRSKVATLDFLTVIECRDFSKNLNVTHVDGLHSKMSDVKADRAVLVARKGFSKTARQKAERLGITLCTAHDIEDKLHNIGLQIPIIIMDVQHIEIKPRFDAHLTKGTSIHKDSILQISDRSFFERFKQSMLRGELILPHLEEFGVWHPSAENSTSEFIRDVDGDSISIDNLEVQYKFSGAYYFGYVNDLPSTIGINNLSQGEVNIFFDSTDIMIDYPRLFIQYRNLVEIPVLDAFTLSVLRMPDFSVVESDINQFSASYVAS